LLVEGPTTGFKDEVGGRNMIVVCLMKGGKIKKGKENVVQLLNN
jgi:hypothetical protein